MANTGVFHGFIGRALFMFGLGLFTLACGGDGSGQRASANTGSAGSRGRDDRGGESRPASTQDNARAGTAGAGNAGTGGAGHAGAAGKPAAENPDKASAGSAGKAPATHALAGAGASAARDAGARDHDEDAGPSAHGADEADAGAECKPLSRPRTPAYPACSTALCPAQDSLCVPEAELSGLAIPAAISASLADCGDGSRCVPSALVGQAGHAILPSCTSVAGAEGRCVSACLTIGAWSSEQLPRDVCAGSDHCAPCFDPLDGSATGVCSLGCDPGPQQPARTFASCCGEGGRCLPPAVANVSGPRFVREGCDEDAVCVPNGLTDPHATPARCASFDGAEGRCLSTCLAQVATLPGLPNQGCANDEVCSPCFDPITGEDTGACRIHADAPTQPVYRFPGCCASGGDVLGRCVPSQFSRVSAAGLFARDSCAGDRVCEPTARLLDPAYRYPSCPGGACIPACLVDPLDALLFTNLLLCSLDEICVPCTVSGACD